MDDRLRIHIVDDDPDVVAMVGQLVRAAGHQLTTSADSRTAAADIVEQRPDCVLLDIMMPEVDGLELCPRNAQSPVRLRQGPRPKPRATAGFWRAKPRSGTTNPGDAD